MGQESGRSDFGVQVIAYGFQAVGPAGGPGDGDTDRFEHVTNAAGIFQKTGDKIEQLGSALKPR